MHKHTWRQEPLHDIVGRSSESHPEMANLCGHVDQDAAAVCILIEDEHHAWEDVYDVFTRYETATHKGKEAR